MDETFEAVGAVVEAAADGADEFDVVVETDETFVASVEIFFVSGICFTAIVDSSVFFGGFEVSSCFPDDTGGC